MTSPVFTTHPFYEEPHFGSFHVHGDREIIRMTVQCLPKQGSWHDLVGPLLFFHDEGISEEWEDILQDKSLSELTPDREAFVKAYHEESIRFLNGCIEDFLRYPSVYRLMMSCLNGHYHWRSTPFRWLRQYLWLLRLYLSVRREVEPLHRAWLAALPVEEVEYLP